MAFAADFARGNPAGSGEFDVLRRRRAHEGIYSLSLVAGCLLGIGISWQTVLSEGARDRLVAGLFGAGEDMEVLTPPAASKLSVLADERSALDAAPVAMNPSPELKSVAVSAAMPELGDALSSTLPARLSLAEEKAAASVPGPVAATEIVFAMNSSFLVSADYNGLRRLVSALPERGSLHVAIAATVSDEPLRNGDVTEAERYNRWLAERRAERVAEWLRGRLGERAAIATDLVPHDPSRRVTVNIRPAP
jgi:hypothetical protein